MDSTDTTLICCPVGRLYGLVSSQTTSCDLRRGRSTTKAVVGGPEFEALQRDKRNALVVHIGPTSPEQTSLCLVNNAVHEARHDISSCSVKPGTISARKLVGRVLLKRAAIAIAVHPRFLLPFAGTQALEPSLTLRTKAIKLPCFQAFPSFKQQLTIDVKATKAPRTPTLSASCSSSPPPLHPLT